jgi:hypothetical protein
LKARRLGGRRRKDIGSTDKFWNQEGIDEELMKWKRDGGLARDKREQETLVTVKAGKRKRRNATGSMCCAIKRT